MGRTASDLNPNLLMVFFALSRARSSLAVMSPTFRLATGQLTDRFPGSSVHKKVVQKEDSRSGECNLQIEGVMCL